MVAEVIQKAIEKALVKLGINRVDFVVEHPADMSHGDYSTNVALVAGKKSGEDPKKLADKLILELNQGFLEKTEVAGPGFINFYLSREFFADSVKTVGDDFGKNENLKGQKIMVEYTDPNVMKPFHIGHLMSNAIGESFARMLEYGGGKVIRANYFSDVGLGIAKAVWGMNDLLDEMPSDGADIVERTDFLGRAYVHGVKKFEEDEEIAAHIKKINKSIYENVDDDWFALYKKGRGWSMEHFEKLYQLLGTEFDELYPESDFAEDGKKIVLEGLKKGTFKESEGAIVFDGGHTRVFVTSEGIATYEAKELALNKRKHEEYGLDNSIIITGNEQDAYFEVVLEAMTKIQSDVAGKTKHVSHGMMRFAEGKMSSRTGNVITGESLIRKVKDRVLEKMEEKDEEVAAQVAVGAIKYAILKQSPGKDIVFDIEQSLSLEGDSGPYLQYTYARAQSVLAKATAEGIKADTTTTQAPKVTDIERLLYRFPEVVTDATERYEPQKIVHFLTELASSFNTFYAQERIADVKDVYAPYKVALTEAVATTLKNGLWLLGIQAPEKM